ncbi:MAG: hypothetical protein ACE5J2_07420 [Nitrososphaerales archaeon]
MQKGRLIAIALGIAVALAVGVAFAFTGLMPQGEQVLEPGTTEGRNVVVNIEEKLGVSEGSSP